MAVEKLKIIWNNLWRKGTILSQSSQDPQHPSSDTQEDTKDMYWKSASLGSPDYISLDVGEAGREGIGTMNFDVGLIKPKFSEWLYGEGAQGKVVSVTKATGTWGVDAAGSIVLEKCEGRFNDNEEIDGSIGGSTMLKVNEPDTGAGVDLIRNGEFEGGTGGWTQYGGATLTSEAGGQVGNCIKILDSTASGSGAAYQLISLEVGEVYRMTVYFKLGDAGYGMIKVGTSIADDTYYNSGNITDATWTKYSVVFKATAVNCYITLYSVGTSKFCYFDEASLYELTDEDTEKEVDFFALLDHNLSPTAIINLKGAWDTAFTEQLETIPISYNEENINAFFTKIIRRYWKLEITDADNPDEYIRVAIPFIGKYFQPNRNPTKGQKRGDRVFSEVELTETLSAYGKEKGTLEQAYLPFIGLTEADKDEIRKMMRECKIDHAFMIVYNTTDPNADSVFYKFTDQPADPQYNHYDSYSWEMNLIEVA